MPPFLQRLIQLLTQGRAPQTPQPAPSGPFGLNVPSNIPMVGRTGVYAPRTLRQGPATPLNLPPGVDTRAVGGSVPEMPGTFEETQGPESQPEFLSRLARSLLEYTGGDVDKAAALYRGIRFPQQQPFDLSEQLSRRF